MVLYQYDTEYLSPASSAHSGWSADRLEADRSAETSLGAAARSGRATTTGYEVFLAGRGFRGFGFSAGFRAGAFGSLNISMYGSLVKLSAVPENSITSPALTVAVTGSS